MNPWSQQQIKEHRNELLDALKESDGRNTRFDSPQDLDPDPQVKVKTPRRRSTPRTSAQSDRYEDAPTTDASTLDELLRAW